MLISLLFVFSFSFTYIIYSDIMIPQRIYYMFFFPLFSKYILKENIYKHQYLSLFICLIGSILIVITVCFKLTKDDVSPNILNFFSGIIYPLFIVLIKYLSNVYYISHFKISLLSGLISIIFLFIGFIIYSLIEYHDLSYFNDSFDFSLVENKSEIIIYIILCFIFTTGFVLFMMLVISFFSPILLMVTDIITPFIYWIIKSFEEGAFMPEVVTYPIGYIILLFVSLIYNEIIILNFWGLSNNTKKFVKQRIKKKYQN